MGRRTESNTDLMSQKSNSNVSMDNPSFEAEHDKDTEVPSEVEAGTSIKENEVQSKDGNTNEFMENGYAVDKAPYRYPTVCSYCHTLWDRNGNTDLLSPCSCDGSRLNIHESCLKICMKKKGKVTCEQCKSSFNNIRYKELKSKLKVQKVDVCLLVILMPVGTILTVTACVMMDAVRRARARAAQGEHVEPDILKYGAPLPVFIVLCVFLGALLIGALCGARSLLALRNNGDKLERVGSTEKI